MYRDLSVVGAGEMVGTWPKLGGEPFVGSRRYPWDHSGKTNNDWTLRCHIVPPSISKITWSHLSPAIDLFTLADDKGTFHDNFFHGVSLAERQIRLDDFVFQYLKAFLRDFHHKVPRYGHDRCLKMEHENEWKGAIKWPIELHMAENSNMSASSKLRCTLGPLGTFEWYTLILINKGQQL